LRSVHAAEAAPGLCLCGLRSHAALTVLCGTRLQMEEDFFVELALDRRLAEEAADAGEVRDRSGQLQDSHDRIDMSRPPTLDLCEAPSTARRDPVVASATVIVRDFPFRLHPAGVFHAMQGRVQRAFLDQEQVLR